ncbi:MAG: MerR family transcriptional regulator [Pseudonocardiales bacterium]
MTLGEVTTPDGTVLWSLPHAAARLQVHERTVRAWEQAGRLTRIARVCQVRYYRRQDVLLAEREARHADPTGKRGRRLARQVARQPSCAQG